LSALNVNQNLLVANYLTVDIIPVSLVKTKSQSFSMVVIKALIHAAVPKLLE